MVVTTWMGNSVCKFYENWLRIDWEIRKIMFRGILLGFKHSWNRINIYGPIRTSDKGYEQFSPTWSWGSRSRDTTSSGWKCGFYLPQRAVIGSLVMDGACMRPCRLSLTYTSIPTRSVKIDNLSRTYVRSFAPFKQHEGDVSSLLFPDSLASAVWLVKFYIHICKITSFCWIFLESYRLITDDDTRSLPMEVKFWCLLKIRKQWRHTTAQKAVHGYTRSEPLLGVIWRWPRDNLQWFFRINTVAQSEWDLL